MLTEEDMKRIDYEAFVKPEHLDLFLTWYGFGGAEKGISLTEIMTLPADVITDFSYLMRELGRYRLMYRGAGDRV